MARQVFTGRTQYVYKESAARASAATFTGDEIHVESHIGVQFIIDISAEDTISATYTIQFQDPIGGDWVTLLASAAKTGVGAFLLTVGPNVATTSNVSLGSYCPSIIRLVVSGTATSITDSVYVQLFNA